MAEPDGVTWNHITHIDPLLVAEFREEIIELILCSDWGEALKQNIVITDGMLSLHPSFVLEGCERYEYPAEGDFT